MNVSDAIYDGIYSGRWEVSFRPYDGVDFSRVCFLFSGQGTAFPGMFGQAYRQLEPVRRHFDEADTLARAAGLPPPSLYITESEAVPDSELVVTRNLATYTVQVALFYHLLSNGCSPRLLTGSSQGEYAALVCSGAVDFASLFEVHVARHRICGPANQLGFLLAVAASPADIAAILGAERMHLSILNSPVRSVIALRPHELMEVQDALGRQRIATKVLEVPHPYHSPIMQPAAERFRAWLEKYRLHFRPPRFPVLSSVTKSRIAEAMSSAAVAELLCRQLIEPVDFPRQIEYAYASRCFAFLEVGPGAALGTFVRKILASREHKILDLEAHLPSAPARKRTNTNKLNPLQSKVFEALRKAIAALTGYEIESISIEDRFQEDLAIDSLKKVEILVSVVEQIDPTRMDLGDLSAMRNVADAVQVFAQPVGHGLEPRAPRPGHIGRHAVVWQPLALPTALARALEEYQLVPLKAVLDREFRLPDDLHGPGLVLLAEPEDFAFQTADVTDPVEDLERLLELFQSFQALAQMRAERDLDIVLVTSGESHPFVHGLAGFFKALMKELPRLFFKHLHFAERPPEAVLLRRVEAERGDRWNIDIRYEDGIRRVAALAPLAELTVTEPVLGDAVVVAFGGAKGITRALLEQLIQAGQPHLYLAGRSPMAELADALEVLSRLTPNLHYTTLDAQDPQAVSALLTDVQRQHGRLDLVINAVGVERSGLLADKSVADMRQELYAKVVPAINILGAAHAASARLILSFCSIASRWGNPGQTIYGCASEIVSLLTAAHNRSVGRIAAVTIEWPPWDGVGMTAKPAVIHQLRQRGLSLLGPARAAALLAAELRRPERGLVTYVDHEDVPLLRAALVDHRAERPLLGERRADDRYQRVLDRTRDPWLLDHTINAVSYLPAASAIAMACGFGSLAQEGACRIEDFQMLQPVAVGDAPVSLWLELEKATDGIGVRGRAATVHFRCRLREEAALPPCETIGLRAGHPLDLDQLYANGLFFHGPTFQVLHQALVADTGELEGRIDSARLRPVYGIDYWDRLTLWLDGAFQVLALAALIQKPVMAIPFAVKRISIADRFARPAFVTLTPKNLRIGDDDVTGNVVLAAEGQRPIIYLQGARLRILPALGTVPWPSAVERASNGHATPQTSSAAETN